jgi:glycosyltransferase involved in cell wall biosynthesis
VTQLHVFVLLPRHLDAVSWQLRFNQGAVPDKTPYGYHFAEELGTRVTFSQSTATPRGLLGLLDKALKRVLGFDIRHAWSNRQALFGKHFSAIWTHTEHEHLAIAALGLVLRRNGPPVIAQSVWLIDEWDRFSGLRKLLYRSLLKRIAAATFLSPANKAIADQHQLAPVTELVLFGISLDSFPLQAPRMRFDSGRPIRVLALGNDRHRDWKTLFDALGTQPKFELRIGSSTWPPAFKGDNVSVSVMSQAEVRAAYDWTDCLVVPLAENLHASGITAILEAVALGIPVVASQTGGLSAYFDNDAVAYVDRGDPIALRRMIQVLACQPTMAHRLAVAAQRQLMERDLTTRGFAFRHVRLSERLISNTSRRPT